MIQYRNAVTVFGMSVTIIVVLYVSTNATAMRLTSPDLPNSQLPGPSDMGTRNVLVSGVTSTISAVSSIFGGV